MMFSVKKSAAPPKDEQAELMRAALQLFTRKGLIIEFAILKRKQRNPTASISGATGPESFRGSSSTG